MSLTELFKKLLLWFGYAILKLLQWLWKLIAGKFRALRDAAATDRPPRWHFGAEQAQPRKAFQKGLLKTEQIRTLEVMPDEVKVLYTKILAAQALVDQQLHVAEFSDLYVFMAQIGLNTAAREQVRKSLAQEQINIMALTDQVIAQVQPEEQEVIRFSLIKDLLRVSRMDGAVSAQEREQIETLTAHLYGDPQKAAEIITFAQKAIDYDEKLLMGKLTADEFTRGAKNLAATAASIGVPITAVYFSGSVIGLSAAGIISGLTSLGLGGILGLSGLVTGIGVVVVMGVVTFKLIQWAVTGEERRMVKIREHMIQEVITLNQKAMFCLAEDINSLAAQMEHFATLSDENRKMLKTLQSLYQDAMGVLQERKDHYVTA